jgi:hypothetical protein
MGAYGLAVAAAFAVALAVLLSVSSTPADASIETRNTDGEYTTNGGTTAAAENGDTVYIRNAATGFVLYEITSIGSASASFTHGDASEDGQSLYCTAATGTTATCDVDTDDSGSTVAVKIDDDSGKGAIFVKHTAVGAATSSTDQITVSVAQVPTNLTVKAASTSIDAKGTTAEPMSAGTTYVDIRLTDANNKGIAGEAITIVSTRAVLATVVGVADIATRDLTVGTVTETVTFGGFTGASLAGSVTTSTDSGSGENNADVDSAGYARVVVTGAGSPGVSTITVTVGELTATADIVLHGTVKTISAELEEGAIEVGGMTRIVVTALDAGDNPVANQNISVKTKGGVTPPERLAKAVATDGGVNKDGGTQGSLKDKGDIPACSDVPLVADDANTDDVNEAVAASSGTNDSGQCVIEVSAPGGGTATKADDAARGTHTIVVVAGTGAGTKGVNEASVEIQVGGAPSEIQTDAPERIDPSAELTVNVTVVDDEGVRVGRVNIEVIHTAGDGAIITDIATKTSDGRAKFTYLAPSTPGVTEFLVRTKNAAETKVTAQEPIIVQIAEAMEEPVEPPEEEVTPPVEEVTPPVEEVMPEPEAPSLTLQFSQGSFSGGSVDELGAAAAAECPGGASVWVQDASGWGSPYVTDAAVDLVNSSFAARFPDGLSSPTFVFVSRCDGDSMANEN